VFTQAVLYDLQKQIGVIQRVIELVRNPGGQLPNRREFPGVNQCLLVFLHSSFTGLRLVEQSCSNKDWRT